MKTLLRELAILGLLFGAVTCIAASRFLPVAVASDFWPKSGDVLIYLACFFAYVAGGLGWKSSAR